MGLNTAKHRIAVDICPDGQIIVWTPAGQITCTSPKQVADVLTKIAKQVDPVEVKPEVTRRVLKTESFSDWQKRGGRITVVEPNVKATLTKEQQAAVTLESLGL